MTGDFEVTVSPETMRSIDSVVEELEIRREPLTGEDRLETAAVLERAGYEHDEILALIGEDPNGDDEQGKSDYSMEQLVSFDVSRLAELFASGIITKEEHRTALEQKAKAGDI
jgi:hypothetical protein